MVMIPPASSSNANRIGGVKIQRGTPADNYVLTYDSITNQWLGNGSTDSLYRQAINNGNFDIWNRGTSVALTTADGYTADQWYVETATAGTDKTISRQDGTGVNGSYYCARVAILSDVDELLTFSQALETQDSIKFRGKKATLSFYARGGAEFVADNATLISKIVTGKGTDQKVLAFTTSADAVSQNNTLTTSWVKFVCTTSAVIASDITQIGISFAFTHAGAGTTTNYFEITQVQLCAGDVALPFQPKKYGDELRACQRYCIKYGSTVDGQYGIFGHGHSFNTTSCGIYTAFPVEMRTKPTITSVGTVGNHLINTVAGNVAPTGVSINQSGVSGAWTTWSADSGLTADQNTQLLLSTTVTDYVYFSADL